MNAPLLNVGDTVVVDVSSERLYTVIGYYIDNDQPWMDMGEGDSPEEAVRDATKDLESPIKVVEVVRGEVLGLLGNDVTMRSDSI